MKSNILYWIFTSLFSLTFFAIGLSDIIQPGNMADDIAKSGYPSQFFKFLGVSQILAACAIAAPRLPRAKEWAYAGVLLNLIAAIHHHVLAGDGVIAYLLPTTELAIALTSYSLRPDNRRLKGPLI